MAGGSDWKPGSCPVIVGPTAAGKTGLVTGLAQRFPIEVISLDSRQVYRGLRIGTAQPTAEEQAACPHHLVDFLPPEENYSAQRFREDFCRVWQEIVDRGKLPVLAGGAGLYLKALTDGFMPLPEGSEELLPEVRAAVAELEDEALAAELLKVDPASAQRLHANDRYRRRRAVEIFRLAGRPLSELSDEQEPDPALGLEFPLVVLERSVESLDDRIEMRTAIMMEAGWIDETQALLAHHAPDCPGMRSIGYAEIIQCLQGTLPVPELMPAIVRVTRQYAKRQRTWFRPLERVVGGAPDAEELIGALDLLVSSALGSS